MARFLPLALSLLAWLTAAAPTTAQTASPGTPAAQPGVIVSPFVPVPGNDSGLPYVPPDIGFPGDVGNDGGGDDDGGGGGSSGGKAPGTRGASGRSPAPSTPASGRSSSSGTLPVTTGTLPDNWRIWWETNKFDFIELHRVGDAPYTGQGRQQETPVERAERLEQVRAVLRGTVAPVLRQLTAAEDPAVRASAVVALGKLRDAESTDVARGLLKDRSLDVRLAAMLALGVLEAGRPSYLLMNIADDRPLGRRLLDTTSIPDVDRGVALLTATLRGDDAPAMLLDQLLEQADGLPAELLASACEASGLMRSSEAIHPLAAIARERRHPEFVRSAAISALGRIGDPTVTPILLELLDSGLEPRRSATVALGLAAHPGLPAAVARLRLLLEDGDGPTRHFAAISLGRIGGPAARDVLYAAFRDPRSDMRPWLALGLGLVARDRPGGAIAELLIERLTDERNVDSLGAYLIALGLCGGEIGLPVLDEHLQGKRVEVAGQAALALGLTGQADALPLLRAALTRSESPTLLSQIALALGILGNSAAAPDLIELIRRTNNPFVASFAALGIAFMGDENAVGPLLKIIEQSGPRGVQTTYAVLAVGQLFDSDRRPALSRLAAGDNYLARSSTVSRLLALGF